MSWTKISESTRTVLYCATVFCVVALILWFAAIDNAVTASSNITISAASPQATFPGTGTGAIPDGSTGIPPQYGAPRVISFAVSGVSANVTEVSVDIALSHTWAGDVDAILRAPGGMPSLVIVSRIGVVAAGTFGDSSNYGGTYSFSDAAMGTNIWTVATDPSCDTNCIIAPGSYRTTAPGQPMQTNPPPVTSLNATFGGMTPAAANGTWTLTFRDAASDDTGTVTAANLTVNPTAPVVAGDAPVDFNGDGKTDYVVVRNIGGGGGQLRWFCSINGTAGIIGKDWGLDGDFIITEDFDNDDIDDIAIWRPGAPAVAAFYILQSATLTARIEQFGQTGDDPTVVDDYNNDGSADLAVYRQGVSAGLQSTWFYRTTPNGPVTFSPWGRFGDFPMPGDQDGDGSADFAIQRGSDFWRNMTTAGNDVITFGFSTDLVVPGDYDGDGKIDIAVTRTSGGNLLWFYRRSTDGVIVGPITFGLDTDIQVHGDYDGDGKVEPAIWRDGVFWSLNSSNGAVQIFHLGSAGDFPVAFFNTH